MVTVPGKDAYKTYYGGLYYMVLHRPTYTHAVVASVEVILLRYGVLRLHIIMCYLGILI